MVSLLLALLLNVTPAECKADPEWCACRRYIAMELNGCQVAAGKTGQHEETRKLAQCLVIYEQGKIACLKNDGDLYPEKRYSSEKR